MHLRTYAILLLLVLLALRSGMGAEVTIDADYPGGNVRVLNQKGNAITIAPDLRDTQGWWFYFNFRLRGEGEQTATITFAEKNPIGVLGPAMSDDMGRTWKWMGKEAVKKTMLGGTNYWSFQARLAKGLQEARFAFTPTYLESHFRVWLERHKTNAAFKVTELCRSRKGRSVEMIRTGCLDMEKARGVVLLTARHHACESMANYSLEGILDEVLADNETGRRWREQWHVIALPFADKDGVEDGDQGKNRAPHDHNRDYIDPPIYPEVAAWIKLGSSLKSKIIFSLDLHCPYISGEWNDRVYIVGSADPVAADKERAFVKELETVCSGPIPFRATEGYLPSGVAWNSAGNYSAGRSNAAWARETFSSAQFTGSIEIPYAQSSGVEVNAGSARMLGRDLAKGIFAYLRTVKK